MNALLQRCREAGVKAWASLVQYLNAISMALLGGALVVHQSYPQLLSEMLGPIPAPIKAGLLFVFGTLVHYAMRQAKKAAE